MTINPYLGFNGNCAEAFKHYEKTLGGKIVMMMTHGDAPHEAQVWAQHPEAVMHVRLVVGDQVLLGGDNPPNSTDLPKGFSVSITLSEPAEAERIYAALSERGSISMPLQPTFWAKRFAMFRDRFGTPWMINCE
jgi:PhnB protein